MRFDALLQIVLGVLFAFAGVVAVMLDGLRIAGALWIVFSILVQLAIVSYGKQEGWRRNSTRIISWVVLVLLVLAMKPIYEFLNGSTIIELSPRVVTFASSYKSSGEVVRHTEYGFGVIARIRKTGKLPERIKALEVVGEIDVDGNDYLRTFGEGMTLEEIDREYGKRKPYHRVSFVSFPININKAEGGEEFVRFMILDPTNIGATQTILRGTDSEHYFGFTEESPRAPIITMTVPNIYSFVNFSGHIQHKAGNGVLLGPRLRDEIKTGRLKFTLVFDSGQRIVNPQNIQQPDMISLVEWDKQTPQDVFFKNNMWDRAVPVEKDPIHESLK